MCPGICNFYCGLIHGTLLPALRRQTEVDLLHGDAALNRTNERAKIAADTLGLVHAGNSSQRGSVRAVLRSARMIELRDRRHGDRRAAGSFYIRRLFMQFHMTVHGPGDAVEMNTLMRSVPTGRVTKV